LQDYNFKIVHVAGKENGPADALSRMHQQDEPSEPKLTPLISPDAFLNVFALGDPGTLEYEVIRSQQEYKTMMKQWEKAISIQADEGPHETVWKDQGG
jgi:hypothetical protein